MLYPYRRRHFSHVSEGLRVLWTLLHHEQFSELVEVDELDERHLGHSVTKLDMVNGGTYFNAYSFDG